MDSLPAQPLSRSMRLVLDRLAEQADGQPSRYQLDFPEARAALVAQRNWWNRQAPPIASARSARFMVAGRTVMLRRYQPLDRCDERVLIYLHGGGWCVGSWRTHDSLLRRLTAGLGMEVVAIDYSLAPEFPFPCALEDVREAVDRLTRSGQAWILAGDSAGASLALADSLSRRDRGMAAAEALILFYGCFMPFRRSDSVKRWGSGAFGLSEAALMRYAHAYCPPSIEPALGSAQRAALYPAEGRLDALPPCMLVAAECDPLLDDSIELQARLQSVGNAVETCVVPGVIHGFMNYGRLLPEVDQVVGRVARFLNARPGAQAS